MALTFADRLAVAAITVMLAACAPVTPAEPSPTLLHGPAPILLPGEDDFVPVEIAGVGGWIGTSSFPDDFDPAVAHENPEAVAEALAAALRSGFAGPRPTYRLEGLDEQSPGRTVAILTEEGAGDDAVAGTQYAVVVEETTAGFMLTELYARALCRRSVTDGLCL